MVEVMKKEDKRAGGEQCIVYVSQRSDVTHSHRTLSNVFQLRTSLYFPSPLHVIFFELN